MDKKYKLLKNDTITVGNTTLYRIRALRSFRIVKAGDLGGYIEKESNLSHEGNSWVFDNASVHGNAKVYGNAEISGNAMVFGHTKVFGDALVRGYAKVSENAMVYENAKVFGNAMVSENAMVYGDARIYGNAKVHGNAKVNGNTYLLGDSRIRNDDDYIVIQGLGSHNRSTTFFRCKDKHIHVKCGCFQGTLEEFKREVEKTHGNTKYGKEYLQAIELVKIHFEV